MPQQKSFIVPDQLHLEHEINPVTHSPVIPLQPICTIKTYKFEISFFNSIYPHVVQVIMKGIETR